MFELIPLPCIPSLTSLPERYALGTVVNLAYGHYIEDDDDIFIRFSKNMTSIFDHPGSSGNTIVDLLPFCTYVCSHRQRRYSDYSAVQHLPLWFPGTYFVSWAKEMKPLTDEFFGWPYERFLEQKERDAAGHAPANSAKPGTVGNWDFESVMGQLVRESTAEQTRDPEHAADIKGIGATLMIAGTDTVRFLFYFNSFVVCG